MPGKNQTVGCILMASGLSERYGKNKLLEKLDGREIILHTAGSLTAAGLSPLAVTRNETVRALMDRAGIRCVLHEGPLKSDTIHAGLEALDPDSAGYLFMPGDQPLVRPASLQKMVSQFLTSPDMAVRLAFEGTAGSPVLFPAFCREKLLAYAGDRGGLEVLRAENIPCVSVQADNAWELWDADTPEDLEKIKEVYARYAGSQAVPKEGPGPRTGRD